MPRTIPAFFSIFLALLPAAAAAEPLLTTGDVAIYKQAFQLVDQEKWVEARALASTAENPLPAKFIQWLDLIRPGPGRSFDEITGFMRTSPDWPGQISLQEQGERGMPPNLGTEEVLAWFADREPATIEGAMMLARALIDKGLTQQAIDMVRQSWAQLPVSATVEGPFLGAYAQFLQPVDHIARLDRLLWAGETAAAERMMSLVDADHQALAFARIKLRQKDPGVEAAVQRVPAALMRDPGLVYERARWRRQNDDSLGAAQMLDPPPPGAAQPELMWRELENAAREALHRGDVSVAYRLAAGHGTSAGVTFADGEWLAGWVAARFLSEHRLGYDHFTRMYAGVGSPVSLARGAYWAGRAAEDMGDIALAQNWYRSAAENLSAYYGQLAAQRLGTLDGIGFDPAPVPTEAERAAFEGSELVRLIRLMAELNESDRSRTFFLRMAERFELPSDLRLLAELGSSIRRDDYMVSVAKIARTKGIEMLDYLYPVVTLPAGSAAEDALVLAIIRQESVFDLAAVSSAGARGLMQLMPATAKHVAVKIGVSYEESLLTRDGDYNIRLGSAYVAELLDRYGGSYILTIAAYNAGPARVSQWINEYGDPRGNEVDIVDWIELIPFSETRNYVQRVLENLQIYRHRLHGTTVALTLEQDLGR
ncbi:MAG: lytic transglycosylase domain-containing protein [Rhodospirillaceae bacterium]|nr:lytic transglycosylase domain-containing protein [Rhodospirillaceae bacterium]